MYRPVPGYVRPHMKFSFSSITHGISSAAHTVASTASSAAHTVASGASSAVHTIGSAASHSSTLQHAGGTILGVATTGSNIVPTITQTDVVQAGGRDTYIAHTLPHAQATQSTMQQITKPIANVVGKAEDLAGNLWDVTTGTGAFLANLMAGKYNTYIIVGGIGYVGLQLYKR